MTLTPRLGLKFRTAFSRHDYEIVKIEAYECRFPIVARRLDTGKLFRLNVASVTAGSKLTAELLRQAR